MAFLYQWESCVSRLTRGIQKPVPCLPPHLSRLHFFRRRLNIIYGYGTFLLFFLACPSCKLASHTFLHLWISVGISRQKKKSKLLKNEDDEKWWYFQFDTSRAFWKMTFLQDQLCRKNWSNNLFSRKGKFKKGRLETNHEKGTVFCLLYQAGDEYKSLTFFKKESRREFKEFKLLSRFLFFFCFFFFFEVLNELRFRLSTSPRWFSKQQSKKVKKYTFF